MVSLKEKQLKEEKQEFLLQNLTMKKCHYANEVVIFWGRSESTCTKRIFITKFKNYVTKESCSF